MSLSKVASHHLLALTALLFAAPVALAQSDLLWARSAGGPTLADRGFAGAARPDGAVLVAGSFSNTADFDGDGIPDVTAAGGFNDTDAFLAAYAGADGALLWVRDMGAIGADAGDFDGADAVAADAAGNAYVVGASSGTADFDGDGVPDVVGDFNENSFLASYDPDGALRWVREVRNSGQNFAGGVALDAAGNAFVTGHFFNEVDFDGDGVPELTHDGGAALYVAAYDAAGTFLWARVATSTAFDAVEGDAAATDAAGNVYVAGQLVGSADFDGDGTPDAVSSGGLDGFVASYTPDGTLRWVLPVGGASTDAGFGIAVGSGTAVFVAGQFAGSADFDDDGTPDVSSLGSYDAFLAAYDADGTLQWVERFGGTDTDRGYAVATDGDGRPYLAGVFSGGVDFDGDGIVDATAQGAGDPFLLALDASGAVLRLNTATGPFFEEALGVAVSTDGQASITGTFDQSLDFDGDGTPDVTTSGNIDLFVASYGVTLAPVAVAAEPVGGPITIGPGGGSFEFTVTLTNTTNQAQTFQAWSEVAGPADREPVVGPRAVTLGPGRTLTRTLRQRVPGAAPAGTYNYVVNVGTFGGVVTASDGFPFEKEVGAAARGSASGEDGWPVSGWESAPAASASSLPEGFALSEAAPNPFRERVQLTLEVSEAQAVRAEVYDALGRRVALLLDGEAEAGAHTLALEGWSLPAGVYVVRVTGETFRATRRVTRVR